MRVVLRNVCKDIKGARVLDNVNLELESGMVYGFKGKNGSGKTMLMRAICGLILPTEGSVSIDGEVLGKDISFPRSIGALIENPGFIANYSGLKNLQILAAIQNHIGQKDIEAIMEQLGLDSADPKKFKKYSLGMKQKLGIAAAVMENPDLIILDEPINALDEKSVEIVKQLLLNHKERGALIIISCHDREELEFLSDEVFCMEDGQIRDHYTVNEN